MDVFSTVVTAGSLICSFLDACSAYSDEAKSLKARFSWDLRVLEVIRSYFEERKTQNKDGQLSHDDAALLEQTSNYLDNLVGTVQRSLGKIERKGLWKSGFNRVMWVARRTDLKEMEKELFEWTSRFDVRVLGLPHELRTIIPTMPDDQAVVPAVVKSNQRLQDFLLLAPTDRKTRAKEIMLKDSDELATLMQGRSNITFLPLQYGPQQLIFSTRKVPPNVIPGTSDFDDFMSDMGDLAAAMNCLDPATGIRLLKVEHYFFHEASKQVFFAQSLPAPTMSMMTLEEMIAEDSFPRAEAPLNERLKIAYKLAESLFFLHTAGFFHKNITSSSVVALRRSDSSAVDDLSVSIDDSYLMGFDLIRANEARTLQEGTSTSSDQETPRSVWDFDVFQHPDRLQGKKSPRFIKTYDVYSLGVVLLQIGLWEPLKDVAEELNDENSSEWVKEFLDISMHLSPRTGERYQKLVTWCLSLKGDHIVKDTEFVEKVLDPLEDIMTALL